MNIKFHKTEDKEPPKERGVFITGLFGDTNDDWKSIETCHYDAYDRVWYKDIPRDSLEYEEDFYEKDPIAWIDLHDLQKQLR
jgi:hypothetical protein